MATIALPNNLQPQSPLLQLPAEIKHTIFGLCLVTDTPISDPRPSDSSKAPVRSKASRVSLLQTCRRLYHEVDRRPLFALNTFRFSNPEAMQSFLRALPKDHRTRIQDVEVDLRQLNSGRPHVTREWLQYLAWKDEGGPSLRADTGGLRCLRLNLQAWPIIPMSRCELWDILRDILEGLTDIERIVVTGASKGKSMAQKAPWSPVHFVGGDNVGTNDLLSRMGNCVVTRPSQDKMIKWRRRDGKLQLEVASTADAGGEANAQMSASDPLPLNGSCTFSAYEQYHSQAKNL